MSRIQSLFSITRRGSGLLVLGLSMVVLVALAPTAATAGTDLNGDGFGDAVFANSGAPDRVCFGDGAGGFASCADVDADTSFSRVVLGDLDADGDVDAVLTRGGPGAHACMNDGSGSFTCTDTGVSAQFIALGDLDGDGDLDALLWYGESRVCMNGGSGDFTCSNFNAPAPSYGAYGFKLADIDGDGDLDAFLVNNGSPQGVCANDGTGVFTCSTVDIGGLIAVGVDLGDIDGDGDPDAIFATVNGADKVCSNHGASVFVCADLDAASLPSQEVRLGDVDGDGDLDAVIAVWNNNHRLCRNNGTGAFTCETLGVNGFTTRAVALTDLEGDGDLDAVFAMENYFNQACVNDGSGAFTCSDISADNSTYQSYDVEASESLPPTGGTLGLSIPSRIPVAEGESVRVPVYLTTAGEAVAAVAFSIDYDHLSVDVTPDPIDLLAFTEVVSHDTGDTDGEIDVVIFDATPTSQAALPESPEPIFYMIVNASSTPALGSTVVAPLDFSLSPSPSFGDYDGDDLFGLSVNGSVEIFPGPRGDCNGSGAITAADLVAIGFEIFDGNGTWTDATGGSFAGSPAGCDANGDGQIDAGDISCTILLLFGGTCGAPPAVVAPDPGALKAAPVAPRPPRLVLNGDRRLAAGSKAWIPVRLVRAAGVQALAFSLDFNPSRFAFDPTDGDGDGVPDAVRFPAGSILARARWDGGDATGELDVALAEGWDMTFTDGVVVEVEVTALATGRVADGLAFSAVPAASFGNDHGQSVPGDVLVRQAAPRR